MQKEIPCPCGFKPEYEGNILQLTDLPDMKIDTGDDDYIGYEHIGGCYSGYNGTEKITAKEKAIAARLSSELDGGTLLDLGCGDGLYAVPLLAEGARLICGDISNKMMKLLYERARHLELDTKKLTLCRLNAYDIPLSDASVDAVLANSMLHLNSNPGKIINEIFRVLKPGGKYLCFADSPAREGEENPFNNRRFNMLVGEFHHRYFEYLEERGIEARRLSWKFDRDAACENLFKQKREALIELERITISTPFSAFYKRMKGRGFSDQSAVPLELHKQIFDKVDRDMREKYGDKYTEIDYLEYQNNIKMTVYIK